MKINRGMSLAEFEGIFWLEYIHRLFGRITGLVVLLPLLYFAAKRALPAPLAVRLGIIFAAGAAQGAIGWYMVQSGLNDIPEVSPYRLALHLGMAMAIFSALVWTWLEVRNQGSGVRGQGSLFVFALPPLIFLQILLGAFVAGNDAGLVYQTFPLMDGAFIPNGLYPHTSWWKNIAEDVTTVQFHHRMMAYLVSGYVLVIWWKLRDHALLIVCALQMALGIATLLHLTPWANAASIGPMLLATAHQANAALLLAASLALCFRLRPFCARAPYVSASSTLASETA